MKKYMLILSVMLISLLAVGAVSASDNNITNDVFSSVKDSNIDNQIAVEEINDLENKSLTTEIGSIVEENISDDVYIQLSGAVNNPGVYKVSCDKRIYEVIEDAGGLKEEADTSKVNLTLPIEDKMLIYIPNVNENETVLTVEGSSIYDSQSTETQLININTASKEELKELPGIGDSKALAIVQYRQENGNFTCIEDIMNISGIKEGAFNKIKALITV